MAEYGEERGTFVMLRKDNFEQVKKYTGHDDAGLRRFLDKANARGETMVKIPIVPLSMREKMKNSNEASS